MLLYLIQSPRRKKRGIHVSQEIPGSLAENIDIGQDLEAVKGGGIIIEKIDIPEKGMILAVM